MSNKPIEGRNYRPPVPHKEPNIFIKMLQKLPPWAWWAGGIAFAAIYILVFYYCFVGPFDFRWKALYGSINYPEGYEIQGIDISHYQGNIDWSELQSARIKDCPIRFIFIKGTEGSDRLDDNFAYNFEQAREHGFVRGVYHFWSNKTTPQNQAQFFLRNVKLEEGDLPPVLDVESKPAEMSREEFHRNLLTWLDIVEKHYGVKPIIYTYRKFKMKHMNDPVFDEYPYWLAHYYVDSVSYEGKWKFWQYTDCGRVDGIKGFVDFDVYNGSYYDLRQLTIGSREAFTEKED